MYLDDCAYDDCAYDDCAYDDCAYDKRLRDMLRGEPYGHHVQTPVDAGLLGAGDSQHFAYARFNGLVIVTKDPDDFEALHFQNAGHPGVIAIYQDNDSRDMSHEEIARAIQNIADVGVPIIGQFHVLNMWRF